MEAVDGSGIRLKIPDISINNNLSIRLVIRGSYGQILAPPGNLWPWVATRKTQNKNEFWVLPDAAHKNKENDEMMLKVIEKCISLCTKTKVKIPQTEL